MFGLVYNIIHNAFKRKEYRVLFAGVDGAGKTTILESMKTIFTDTPGLPPEKIIPTTGLNITKILFNKVWVVFWDLGGEKGHRDLVWPNYLAETQALVYVVDVFDSERMAEAKATLDNIFQSQRLHKVPVLILLNKTDQLSPGDEKKLKEVETFLELDTYDENLAAYRFQPCSTVTKQGIKEGIDWLATYLDIFVPSYEPPATVS